MAKQIKNLRKYKWVRFVISVIMTIASSLLQVYTIQVLWILATYYPAVLPSRYFT